MDHVKLNDKYTFRMMAAIRYTSLLLLPSFLLTSIIEVSLFDFYDFQ